MPAVQHRFVFMPSKPSSSKSSSLKSPSLDDRITTPVNDPAAVELDEKLAAKAGGRPVIGTSAAPPPSDNEYDDEDDELAIEDERGCKRP